MELNFQTLWFYSQVVLCLFSNYYSKSARKMITMQEMRVLEEKLTFFHSSFHFRIHTSKQVSMESVTVMQIDF